MEAYEFGVIVTEKIIYHPEVREEEINHEKDHSSTVSPDPSQEITPRIPILWNSDHPHRPHRPLQPPTTQ
jgi:hypothetical protein